VPLHGSRTTGYFGAGPQAAFATIVARHLKISPASISLLFSMLKKGMLEILLSLARIGKNRARSPIL
jgi:hypothetical protein